MGTEIRAFLMDDHEVVRQGVRALLESSGEIEVVGEASNAAEALARIPALQPDVAVLDVRVPDGNGIEVCREIRSSVGTNCLMLTSYSDDEALFDLMRDETRADDGDLPETGVGVEHERLLSPLFIRSPDYGTRATTLLTLRSDGTAYLAERTFGPDGARGAEQTFTFEIG